jgi:putative acetyltransferase
MRALHVRPIRPHDDGAVAEIIRTVMTSFGASGPGFAIHDPEVSAMSAAYDAPGHAYFVLETSAAPAEPARVVGGGGVAPLRGTDDATCELRKMYFLPEARGRGAGRALLERCLERARELGYRRCYLETLTGMDAAQALYAKLGFEPLRAARGATGHHGCNRFYQREL